MDPLYPTTMLTLFNQSHRAADPLYPTTMLTLFNQSHRAAEMPITVLVPTAAAIAGPDSSSFPSSSYCEARLVLTLGPQQHMI
jgi:hypothetical protein